MNRSILKVGYVSFYFPNIFYDEEKSTLTGIYPDIWKDYGRISKKDIHFIKKDEYGGYLPDAETGLYAGMLGDVQRGELDGIVDAYSSQPERIPYFRVSSEVDYTTESFFEADSISLWANLIEHFIFDGWSYLLISIFLIIFNLIFLIFKLQPLKNLKLSYGMTYVFYLIFVTFLFLFYNAEFNAIAIVPTFNISTNFRTLVDGFHNGQRKMITTSGTYLRAEHYRELFGVNAPGSDQLIIEKDVQLIFNKLCADPRLVYYDGDSIMMSTSQSKYPLSIKCPLRKIDTSDLFTFPVDSAVRRKKFGQQKTYYEKFVDLQLKLYRYEQISGIHLRRYISRDGSSNPNHLATNQVTFSFVAAFSIVLVASHSFSLLLFVFEIIIGNQNSCRKNGDTV
ncbi:hypothetical protein PRIPAC_81111 [Pristionchus pacificus]|uniref:Uncharacterized protein n=1 Tax=Pristionchus pacificus TaxID=54126 RepID=A0A2A6C2U8_PRIPA|nr:hypothetical protein PRIPAC_81111 [Pristionchus pacificus]|eukprot:PDM72428.1 hypothetical protein PRIPAC_38862 [Pristionchus pacificus]